MPVPLRREKLREEREREEQGYANMILSIFEESGGVYGAGRICAELRKRGFKSSFKRVMKYMNELG